METSRTSTQPNTMAQLTLLPEDSHASHSAQQENVKAQTTSAISGRKCFALYGKYSPLTSLAKMLLESTQWTMGVYSSKYALIWKMKVTPFNRFVFQLVPRVRRTGVTDGGLLGQMREEHPEDYQARTEEKGYNRNNKWTSLAAQIKFLNLLPTPSASPDGRKPQEGWKWNITHWRDANGKKIQSDVRHVIEMLPTPAKRDYKGANSRKHLEKERGHHDQLPNAIAMAGEYTGMKLQPGFVEWMMGYPPGWTHVEADD